MAITTAGISIDNVLSDDSNLKSFIEQALPFITSSSNFNQGDNVCLDSSGHYLRAVTADTDASSYLGVAPVTVVAGILAGPYPSGVGTVGSQQPQAVQGPLYGLVAALKIVAGDSLVPGSLLYLPATSDTQTLTVTDTVTAGNYVAVYQGPALTAVAGVRYPCKVGMRLATGQLLQF